MSPTLPPNRSTGRSGVNAAKALFESNNYIFQEVNIENDFGKDAYVDLVNGREVTGLCVALQIKSGASFRRASGYAIPIEGHLEVWRKSSLPVAGIVFDPENGNLYWCDITDYLQRKSGEKPTSIPVPPENILNNVTLERDFKPRMRESAGRRSVGTLLLQLCNSTEEEQLAAISDCFAVGRYESRVLILLRYLLNMLDGEPLKYAIFILSHATPHPDIFWRKENWIPDRLCDEVMAHFVWSDSELYKLFATSDGMIWDRGQFTQCLYMVLSRDKGIKKKMEVAMTAFCKEGRDELAFRALYLVVFWAKDATSKYTELVTNFPELRNLEMIPEFEYILEKYGEIRLF